MAHLREAVVGVVEYSHPDLPSDLSDMDHNYESGSHHWWQRDVRIIRKLKAALALKRVADAIEKENKMGHDWKRTLKSAGVDFLLTCGAVLLAYFSKPEALAQSLGALPESVRLALIPIISAVLVALRKRIKFGGVPKAAGALIFALLLPGIASAQEPAPKPAVTVNLYGGAMQFAERCTAGLDECTPDHKDEPSSHHWRLIGCLTL